MRVIAEGSFGLPLAATDAIGLFTPEGERVWVPGWDPRYPGGRLDEVTGTVFVTDVDGIETSWVVIDIDRDRCTASYARVTPGRHAGIVSVRCTDGHADRCRVEVRYDLTLAEGADPSLLAPYEGDAYEAMLRDWAALIATAS